MRLACTYHYNCMCPDTAIDRETARFVWSP